MYIKGVLGILDADEEYASALSANFSRKQNAPMDVVHFTSMEGIQAFTEHTRLHMLLCGEECLSPELENMQIVNFALLTEEACMQTKEGYPRIFRYQSAEMIWQQVLLQYEMMTSSASAGQTSSYTDIYTVYSPVTHCGKTMFSLALSKILAEHYKTLYLNFEDYSGIEALLCKNKAEKDLSDAIYYFGQQNLGGKLPMLIKQVKGFSFILPVRCPADIRNLSKEQIEGFVTEIRDASHYDAVVIDAGNGLTDVSVLFKMSKKIYVPVREDEISLHRIHHMEEHFKVIGWEEILQKMIQVKVPYQKPLRFGKNDLEQLFWGELSDYVRSVR